MDNHITKGDTTMWTIWDKQTEINGFSAEHVLNTFKHLTNEETIFIKTVNGRVTQVEGKGVLAFVYGIDPTLANDEFIAEYERILTEPTEEASEDLTEGGLAT